jgi:hypothetical protein
MISTMPSQKEGMEMPRKAVPMLTRSTMEFCLTAEMMPMGKAISRAKNIAPNASSMVAGSRSPISLATGCWREKELPRSPRARPPKIAATARGSACPG